MIRPSILRAVRLIKQAAGKPQVQYSLQPDVFDMYAPQRQAGETSARRVGDAKGTALFQNDTLDDKKSRGVLTAGPRKVYDTAMPVMDAMWGLDCAKNTFRGLPTERTAASFGFQKPVPGSRSWSYPLGKYPRGTVPNYGATRYYGTGGQLTPVTNPAAPKTIDLQGRVPYFQYPKWKQPPSAFTGRGWPALNTAMFALSGYNDVNEATNKKNPYSTRLAHGMLAANDLVGGTASTAEMLFPGLLRYAPRLAAGASLVAIPAGMTAGEVMQVNNGWKTLGAFNDINRQTDDVLGRVMWDQPDEKQKKLVAALKIPYVGSYEPVQQRISALRSYLANHRADRLNENPDDTKDYSNTLFGDAGLWRTYTGLGMGAYKDRRRANADKLWQDLRSNPDFQLSPEEADQVVTVPAQNTGKLTQMTAGEFYNGVLAAKEREYMNNVDMTHGGGWWTRGRMGGEVLAAQDKQHGPNYREHMMNPTSMLPKDPTYNALISFTDPRRQPMTFEELPADARSLPNAERIWAQIQQEHFDAVDRRNRAEIAAQRERDRLANQYVGGVGSF